MNKKTTTNIYNLPEEKLQSPEMKKKVSYNTAKGFVEGKP